VAELVPATKAHVAYKLGAQRAGYGPNTRNVRPLAARRNRAHKIALPTRMQFRITTEKRHESSCS
jgi:hypothetical protein